MGELSWTEVVTMGMIPGGQLWARIFNFNGSVDKWWLMIPFGLIPIIGIIPMIAMKYGYVANGTGSNPIDYMMLLPIIAKFVIPFILPFVGLHGETTVFNIVAVFLELLCIIVANLTRRYNDCKSVTVDSIGKASMDSVIAYGVGDILATFIGFIPFIGIVVSILEGLPGVGDYINPLVWSIGFGATYILLNMFNQADMTTFCSTPFYGNTSDKMPFIVSAAAIIGLQFFNSPSSEEYEKTE